MKKAFLIYKYIIYKLRSTNEHGIHSPFVFDLYNQVFKNQWNYYSYSRIEEIRKLLLSNKKEIAILDLGAGSNFKIQKSRSIADITATASKNKKYSQLLFRLADYFQPKTILELGTSVGISTMYLAMAQSQSEVITIEGSPEIQKIAVENFNNLEISNVKSINGNFDDELPKVLNTITALDLVFFDGNHRKDATLNYFNKCLEKANSESVFIFDDIYWSREMSEAWAIIKNDPRVTVTIDIFQMGIVFFRKEQAKQHFILKF